MISNLNQKPPVVSVIIPAYNQAVFLKEAIQSVLSQTFLDYEIIVVDDGSTDDTPNVISQFGDKICFIRQTNQGLGGARNTGIRNAKGKYIAFLDSDDLWLPEFLETILDLATNNADASVFYCSAQYMDSEGRVLPQLIDARLISSSVMYEALSKANFIIPSSVVIQKSAVVAVGLFDQNTPAIHGCEDWDLWLRLAPTNHFISTQKCLVRYRLHNHSLSADAGKMQRAAMAVINKNFGPDDGYPNKWSRIKQLAYGGIYRYLAWTSVVKQNDWDTCIQNVSRALQIDASTSKEIDLFYDLAMGHQPLGYRGTSYQIDIKANILHLRYLLCQIFKPPVTQALRTLRRQTFGTAYFAIGLVAYQINELAICRHYFFLALYFRPELWRDPRVIGNFVKSFLGHGVIDIIRKIRYKRNIPTITNI